MASAVPARLAGTGASGAAVLEERDDALDRNLHGFQRAARAVLESPGVDAAFADHQPVGNAEQLGIGELDAGPGVAVVEHGFEARRRERAVQGIGRVPHPRGEPGVQESHVDGGAEEEAPELDPVAALEVRVGRGAPEGFADPTSLFIAGSNLTATKARLLLMACLMKFGSLPAARDPDCPTAKERSAIEAAVEVYQRIFDTH